MCGALVDLLVAPCGAVGHSAVAKGLHSAVKTSAVRIMKVFVGDGENWLAPGGGVTAVA